MNPLDRPSALVLVDLQRGIVGQPMAHPTAGIVTRAAALADAARARRTPVVVVNVAGAAPGRTESPPRPAPPEGWTEIVSELALDRSDLRVTKHCWNAFSVPTLDAMLRESGVEQILLAGIATSMGVESTARSAHERGYDVVLVTDAMTDPSREAHENSVERIFPKLGRRTSTAELVAALRAPS